MALSTRHNLIKRLQTTFARGTPFDHADLASVGVSSALTHHYLKSGWLVRLGRGVPAIQWKIQNLARLKKANPRKFAQQAEELRARFAAM